MFRLDHPTSSGRAAARHRALGAAIVAALPVLLLAGRAGAAPPPPPPLQIGLQQPAQAGGGNRAARIQSAWIRIAEYDAAAGQRLQAASAARQALDSVDTVVRGLTADLAATRRAAQVAEQEYLAAFRKLDSLERVRLLSVIRGLPEQRDAAARRFQLERPAFELKRAARETAQRAVTAQESALSNAQRELEARRQAWHAADGAAQQAMFTAQSARWTADSIERSAAARAAAETSRAARRHAAELRAERAPDSATRRPAQPNVSSESGMQESIESDLPAAWTIVGSTLALVAAAAVVFLFVRGRRQMLDVRLTPLATLEPLEPLAPRAPATLIRDGASPDGFVVRLGEGKGAVQLTLSSAQAIGRRGEQQDAFGFSDPNGSEPVNAGGVVGVVADGMGDLGLGSQASQLAVGSFLRAFSLARRTSGLVPAALEFAFDEANGAVTRFASGQRLLDQVATTFAAVAVGELGLHWIATGNTRIYIYRGGQLHQVNADHVVQRVLARDAAAGRIGGDEILRHPERQAVTSYLGSSQPGEIDRSFRPVTLLPGDRVLVCTDGVHNVLTDAELARVIADRGHVAAEAILELAEAQSQSDRDNMTVIGISLDAAPQRISGPKRISGPARWSTPPSGNGAHARRAAGEGALA